MSGVVGARYNGRFPTAPNRSKRDLQLFYVDYINRKTVQIIQVIW